MKKPVKITLISLGSLVGLVLVVFLVACWLLFTPARLTSIVNKLSDRFITCESHFERVDLTLFRTFPDAGLDVHNVVLINPMEGAPDTLATIGSLTVAIHVRDFLKQGDIRVRQLLLDGVQANLYTDAEGRSNLDIFPPSTDTTPSEPFSLPDHIELKKIALSHLNATYVDLTSGIQALVEEGEIALKGSWKASQVDADLALALDSLSLRLRDSLGAEQLATDASRLRVNLTGVGALSDLQGALQLAVPSARVALGGECYVTPQSTRKELLKVDLPYHANLEEMQLSMEDAQLAIAQFALGLDGDVALPVAADSLHGTPARDMQVDVAFAARRWDVEELLSLLPDPLKSWSNGMALAAKLGLEGTAKGALNDSLMPLIDAKVTLDEGRFADHSLLPYDFKRISADVDATLDLSAQPQPSRVRIHSVKAVTGKNKISLSGTIDDLLGRFLADVRLQGDIRLPDIAPLLPDDLDLEAKGDAKLNLHAKADLEQITAVDLSHMQIDGAIDFHKLDVRLDSLTAESPSLRLEVSSPDAQHARLDDPLLDAVLKGGSLHAVVPAAGIVADLTNVQLDAVLSNVLDSTVPFAVNCDFDLGRILAQIDSMQASLVEPSGHFVMQPNRKNPARVKYEVDYRSESLYFKLNDSMSLNMAGLTIQGGADYDSTRGNVLQQWSPDLDVDFKNGYVDMAQLMYMLQIPDIKFNYKPERCEIASANVVFGNSDFYLSGAVTGLEKWLSHQDMLRGDLYFTSNFTNVDDLMATFSGMGSDEDTLQAQREEDAVPKEANPFIVPRDVDFTLHTRIKEAVAFENELQELAGDVTIRDGVAVLDQIGFVCKAARMQLTALYKTPRVNHIFAGLDFHLLDIQVDELIDMIPMVDTLVPLLAAFDGNADFHLAAETYLNAFYQPKMSTLRGAADINGTNLVVMDNEKISTLAKLLKMKEWKRDDDKLQFDSLDVAMTVFRKEVEVYPFLLSLNKYQLVASGRQSLAGNCDYHLEIVKTPLPGRLAVDVLSLDPFKFKLSEVRYADLFRPGKRNDVEEQTLRLKQQIRESLEANVRQSTRDYQGLEN